MMQRLCETTLDDLETCPYLPDRQKRFANFLAVDLSPEEMRELLESGWRRFGPYFFRPECPGCRQCIPLRIPVRDFRPSRSQRRVLTRNRDLEARFGPLFFSPDRFAIYRRHSLQRFGQESTLEEFLMHFYLPACPAWQIDVLQGGELLGVGFLDQASNALSSVYFCFDPEREERRLGTFSILREIERARELGLDYYYLGYYVPGCPRMAYKDSFHPREHYDWETASWRRVEP